MKILLVEDSSKTKNGGGQMMSSLISEYLKKRCQRIFYVDFSDNNRISKYLNKNDGFFFIKRQESYDEV